ncbi:hypothetical protein, partial [Nitrosomonas communis]|uniref:hypothetical protein n=1 Tax=Nitrosomonas communis TaxID=44574 RepID=UPI003D27DADA
FKAGTLEIRNGAFISGDTFRTGKGGDLSVKADHVFLSGDGAAGFTGITAQARPESSGNTGNVSITAGTLEIRNEAAITTDTFSTGKSGNLSINTGSLKVLDGATISAKSLNTNLTALLSKNPETGKSGNITVEANTIHLQNKSSITVDTEQANAGSINISKASRVHILDQSAIKTSVADGNGSGGGIGIKSQLVVLDATSMIIADANEGSGGDINIDIIKDGAFLKTPDKNVSASSKLGINGSVTINVPESNIIGSISILPVSFLDISSWLSDYCSARAAGGISSFVTVGRGGMLLSPDISLPAFYLPAEAKTHQENSEIKKREFMPDKFKKVDQLAYTPLIINCDK